MMSRLKALIGSPPCSRTRHAIRVNGVRMKVFGRPAGWSSASYNPKQYTQSRFNGRMGRLWQTLILKAAHHVLEFLPTETLIRARQEQYYEVLRQSDRSGETTLFIEFMFEIIHESLQKQLKHQSVSLSNVDRIALFNTIVQSAFFTRKESLKNLPTISSATASRELRLAVEKDILEKTGDKNTTRCRHL